VVEMHPDVWISAGTSRRSAEALIEQLELIPVPLEGQSDPLWRPRDRASPATGADSPMRARLNCRYCRRSGSQHVGRHGL